MAPRSAQSLPFLCHRWNLPVAPQIPGDDPPVDPPVEHVVTMVHDIIWLICIYTYIYIVSISLTIVSVYIYKV